MPRHDENRVFGYGNRNHFGKGPKGWKRSDERIKDEACEALYRDPHIDAREIDLSVESGRVFLRGTVQSRETKKRAEDCVENVSGVVDVQNELRIDNRTISHADESLESDYRPTQYGSTDLDRNT